MEEIRTIYKYDDDTKKIQSLVNIPPGFKETSKFVQYGNKFVTPNNKVGQNDNTFVSAAADDCISLNADLPLDKPIPPVGLPHIVQSTVNLIPVLQNPIPINHENPSTNLGSFRENVKQMVLYNVATQALSQGLSIDTDLQDKSYKLYAGYRYLDFSLDPLKHYPVTPNTIFKMSSSSKVVTAATFLKYVEDNKISLSEKLEKYFPEYSNPEVIKLINPITSTSLLSIVPVVNTTKVIVSVSQLSPIIIQVQSPGDMIGELVSLKCLVTPFSGLPSPTSVYPILSVQANDITWDITIDLKKTYNWSGVPAAYYNLDILTLNTVGEAPCYNAINAPISYETIANPVRFYYTTVPASNKITIKHLMTHRSGHVYTDIFTPVGHSAFRNEAVVCAAIARLKHPEFRTTYPNIDVLEWVKLTSDVPLAFEPGTAWSYGIQLGILGGVLVKYERMKSNNMSLYQIQKEYIFDPLDMNSASYFIQDNDSKRNEKISNLIHGYTLANVNGGIILTTPGSNPTESAILYLYGYLGSYADGANPNAEGDANPWHPIYGTNAPRKLELGDVGLIMNNEDFAKFTYMLRNKGTGKNGIKVLKKETVEDMYKNQIDGLSITLAIGDSPKPPFLPNQKWGLGVRVEDDSTKTDGMSYATMSWKGSTGSRWLSNSKEDKVTNYNSMTNSGLSGQFADYIAINTVGVGNSSNEGTK